MAQSSVLESFVPNSKITVLINSITAMSKHPSIESDLSQILDDFLGKLSECDKYLENGIFNMNFAEAALLIQSSADLYSKKVDLLWDVIFDYQKKLLSEEQNADKEQEMEKLEERKRKYKRKRKTNTVEAEATQLVNSFSFGHADNHDYLNQSYETTDLSREWKKFYSESETSKGYVTSKNSLFLPNNSVYTEDNDYLGRYDQFHSASLVDEIFHLEKNKLLTDEGNCITKMRIDSYVINDFLLERNIPSTKPLESYSSELDEYINNFVQSHQLPEKDAQTQPPVHHASCRKSVVCIERLPFNVVRDKLRRHSLADSLFDDDHMSSVSECCPSGCNAEVENCEMGDSFEQVNTNLENRSKSCSQDSAFYEDMEGNDTVEDTENGNDTVEHIEDGNATVANIEDGNATVAHIEDGNATVEHTEEGNATVEHIEDENEDTTDDINSGDVAEEATQQTEFVHVTADSGATVIDKPEREKRTRKSKIDESKNNLPSSIIVTRMKVPRKWDRLLKDEEEEEEIAAKKPRAARRMSRKALEKLATGISAPHRDFEKFCRLQYKPADGEGNVPAYMSDSESSEEEENDSSADEDDNNDHQSVMGHNEELSDLEEEEEDDEPNESSHLDEGLSEDPQPPHPLLSPIPDLNQPSTSANPDLLGRTSTPRRPEISGRSLSFTDDDDDVSRKTVREWRSFIIPKLRTLENRADFDIHEYGSRIIGPSQVGESRRFKDIVEGKNPAEVARYFIATLQLANTYNIEITGAVGGEVANESFAVKTLDKTRHHELLEDYQAPSEETFRERLERVKALNPKIPLHSTPPVKRQKFGECSRKKLF